MELSSQETYEATEQLLTSLIEKEGSSEN